MLGKNIKYFREKEGYSQEELGNLMGVTKHTISSWECGRQMPSRKHIDGMLNIFCVPEYEFFCRLDLNDSLSKSIDRLFRLKEHHQYEVIGLISKIWMEHKYS